MTRRFLDDIRADKLTVAAAFTDLLVTAGDTTAPALNGILQTNLALDQDMLDSVTQDESAIASNAPSLGVATTAAFTPLTTGIYDIAVGGDDDFLTVDAAAGTITTSPIAGFTYTCEGRVTFQDIGSSVPIEFSILADGVQAGFIGGLTGGGNTRPRTVAFSHIKLATPANTVYTIGVRTPNGNQDIDITSIAMSCFIQATNNPT